MSEKRTKRISVFVDESGSFDASDIASRYYIVCMVFHDQDEAIIAEINQLGQTLVDIGQSFDASIHAAPLVRREKEYSDLPRTLREPYFLQDAYFCAQGSSLRSSGNLMASPQVHLAQAP